MAEEQEDQLDLTEVVPLSACVKQILLGQKITLYSNHAHISCCQLHKSSASNIQMS